MDLHTWGTLTATFQKGVKDMPKPFKRRDKGTTNSKFFYFNVADESHAKILERSRKVDPMQAIGRVVAIDEY
jgi:hypothetical protein